MTKSFEPENVSLQNHKEISEERIQQKIAENPSILSPFGSVQKITRTKLIFVMLLGLFACSSATNRQAKTSETLPSGNISIKEKQTASTNCARGVAKPIIKKTVYPQTTFVLQSDSLTGIETVIFDNGDNLTIKNWGCEYYVLTFRFETSRLQQDTTSLDYWFKSAASLTTEVLDGLEAPIDIAQGVDKLLAHVNNNANLKLRKEIDYGTDNIRSFVSVDRIEKDSDTRYAVEISFATGPL
jgi:hypothetical protein